MAEQSVLSAKFSDQNALYRAYMPFVEAGGIFIRTKKTFKMGEAVVLSLQLMDDEPVDATGKVVWITPAGAQGGMPQGVGVRLNEGNIVQRIETLLAGRLDSPQRTHTM